MKPNITPLSKRPSLGADITQQLHALIQAGVYKPGDVLPGQRELASQFGTSVPSVREAISVLSAAGILSAKAGRGTVITALEDQTPAFDGWLGVADPQELWETRRLLEHHTIAGAAKRATPQQKAELRRLYEAMGQWTENLDRFIEADMAFHLGIAQVAGNRVITRLMQVIQAPLHQHIRANVERVAAQGRLMLSLNDHGLVLAAIELGKARLAQTHYDQMLQRAMQPEVS